MTALSHTDRLLAMAAEARGRASAYDGSPGPGRRTDTRPLAATLNADADALEAGAAALSPPAEGVKLEPVAVVLRKLIDAYGRFEKAPDHAEVWLGGWSTYSGSRDPDKVHADEIRRALVSGPQAAKRIEELEAEVARLSSLAFGLMNGDDQ